MADEGNKSLGVVGTVAMFVRVPRRGEEGGGEVFQVSALRTNLKVGCPRVLSEMGGRHIPPSLAEAFPYRSELLPSGAGWRSVLWLASNFLYAGKAGGWTAETEDRRDTCF